MPRATAEAAAETARRVLAAGAELFAAEGYAAVSVDDVAQHAGVTRGAVYHHYRNKVGLFRAVAADLQSGVAAAVVAAAERADGGQPDGGPPGEGWPDGGQVCGGARAQLSAGSHAFLDAITAAPVVRVLLVDAPAVIGWAQWRDLDAENSMVHLGEALSRVGVPDDLLEAMTAQLSGAMNEAALWLAERSDCSGGPDPESRRAAHRVLDRLLEAVVGSEPAGVD